jgi:methionyl aminopeptidase
MEQEILDNYIKAGKIASEAREYGKSLIKKGASLLEVSDLIEKKIEELGGELAFPVQISLNDIAAHYCADHDDKTVFKQGDICKLDIGVHVDGYVADTACTVDLGDNSDLVKASEDALNNAIKLIKPGVTLGEIGAAIEESIKKYNLNPIRNLSGHGVGRYIIHGNPTIPNFDTGDDTELKENDIIAIEPFATNGSGLIYETDKANIFSMVEKRPVRSPITREVLKEIEKYNDLPFTTRWLAKKYPLFKVSFALRELMQMGVIRNYPPLPDKSHGLVSQAEHTIIVRDEPIVITK